MLVLLLLLVSARKLKHHLGVAIFAMSPSVIYLFWATYSNYWKGAILTCTIIMEGIKAYVDGNGIQSYSSFLD